MKGRAYAGRLHLVLCSPPWVTMSPTWPLFRENRRNLRSRLLPLSNLPLTCSNFLIKTRPATCLTGLWPFPSQSAEATTLPQPIGRGHDPSPANRLPLDPYKTFGLLKLPLSPWYLTAASVPVRDWALASSNKGSFAFASDSAPWCLWGSRILGITQKLLLPTLRWDSDGLEAM